MVVQRYAQALFKEASEASSVTDDVNLIRSTLGGSPELERLLESPVVPRQKKNAILQSLFGERVQVVTLRFLQILVERGRESLLGAVLERFLVLSNEARGIIAVQARVTSELLKDEKDRLQEVLSTSLGLKVQLETTVDSTLMGGIILKIGDTVYDGSVRHQLSLLQTRLRMQA